MDPVPGAALPRLGPAAAAALVATNDIWLRPHLPGWIGGKLSGLGVAFLLPVVLAAAGEWVSWLAARAMHRRWRPPGRPLHLGACAVTALYAAGMELVPGFGSFHEAWLEAVVPWVDFRPGTPDPTDLLCLLAVPLACLHLERVRPPGGARSDPPGTP